MVVNRGKQFEDVIKQAFLNVPDVSVDRLHDQMSGYFGSKNICDFIVYKKPYEYYIECKSVHRNILSIHSIPKLGKDGKLHGFHGNITDTQWDGLIEKSKIQGVRAGIICWWIDLDKTYYIPMWVLEDAYKNGYKSINLNYPYCQGYWIPIDGKKKRVFFDYDMTEFFRRMEKR